MLQLLNHGTCSSSAVNISPSCTVQKQFTVIPFVNRCVKLTIRIIQKKWKDNTLSISPKNTGEKRKDQENIIMTTITIIIMIITMAMTRTEIVGPATGIDHIVETDHETTIKMITMMITETTIELTIEMTTEITVEKKIIGISKTRNIRKSIEIIMKTQGSQNMKFE